MIASALVVAAGALVALWMQPLVALHPLITIAASVLSRSRDASWVAAGDLELALSLAAGALLGAEREFMGKPAGLREFALMATLACAATEVGIHILAGPAQDASRIPAYLFTAGATWSAAAVIFRDRGGFGATTALGVLYALTIGVCFGAGANLFALTLTGLGFAILSPLGRTLRRLTPRSQRNGS
ncbi:MAG TPA: MgtC/SapB family protein [Solirubrobacteraceae bacterium]|nr:MgtC/SapB family protein [Solirubrobacteraceae bacterium]